MTEKKKTRENLTRVTVWIDRKEWLEFGKLTISRSKDIRAFISKKINKEKSKK